VTLVKAFAVAIGALVFAVIIAPASLIDTSLATQTQQRIRLIDTTGFWWRGSGIIVSADAAQRVPIDWQLDGKALARGSIVVAFGRGNGGRPITGMLSLRSGGFDITGARVRIPAAFAVAVDPRLQAVTLGGTIDAIVPSLSAARDALAGNVDATWTRARVVTGDAVFDLGTVSLKSTAASNRGSASIQNTGGNVAVAGTIVFDAANGNGTLELRPESTASPAVRNVLARLGVPDQTGGVRITWQNPR
jgi:hypothetical protein